MSGDGVVITRMAALGTGDAWPLAVALRKASVSRLIPLGRF